jgi:cellulose synthase/poly-beta-1,6-N-acetylglucosamine synthase-like glycosyltransferase
MTGGLVALILDIVLLGAWMMFPLFRRGDEDSGDGFAVVEIAAPYKVHPLRTFMFYGTAIALTFVLVAHNVSVTRTYGAIVASVVNAVTGRPDLTKTWVESVVAIVPLIAGIDIAVFGFSVRASLARRMVIMLNGVVCVVMTMSIDALLLVLWGASGTAVGPKTLIGAFLVNVLVGTASIVRVIASSFQLPRPTSVPLLRKRWNTDGFIAVAVVAGAVCFVIAGVSLIHMYATEGWIRLTSHVAYPVIWIAVSAFLLLVAGRGRMPDLIADRPPIEVIIPAYNETAGIHMTLRSLDRAAANYGGRVRVVLADDGSTDGTGDAARAEMAAFTAATGIVVAGLHMGKSAALNTALSYTEAEIIIRVDADVVVDDKCFLPLPTWFAEPTVGSVGAMTYPRMDVRSYFHKMRLFECLFAFGFVRQASCRVDGLSCIPGTYTAFRREAVMAIGGFVTGMNGEDADLTMQLGRLGYRAILDPRIVIYEDVPPTLPEFREQRIRWNRAGTQVFARHSPWTSGFAGPRVWLTYLRIMSMRFFAIARPVILAYLIATAVVAPGVRPVLLVLIGTYAISSSPSWMVISLLAVRHHLTPRLRYLVFWWPYTMLRRAFIVESLLSLPTKTVTFSPVWALSRYRTGPRLPNVPGPIRPPEPVRPH